MPSYFTLSDWRRIVAFKSLIKVVFDYFLVTISQSSGDLFKIHILVKEKYLQIIAKTCEWLVICQWILSRESRGVPVSGSFCTLCCRDPISIEHNHVKQALVFCSSFSAPPVR